MILVDSSVWISYFAGQQNNASKVLHQFLKDDIDIAIVNMILTEVLSGFKSDKDFKAAAKVLYLVPSVPISRETCIHAAKLFRSLRKKGITVRGAIDCIIAQCCIEIQAELLTIDRDFNQIAKESSLQIVQV